MSGSSRPLILPSLVRLAINTARLFLLDTVSLAASFGQSPEKIVFFSPILAWNAFYFNSIYFVFSWFLHGISDLSFFILLQLVFILQKSLLLYSVVWFCKINQGEYGKFRARLYFKGSPYIKKFRCGVNKHVYKGNVFPSFLFFK